MGLVKAPPHFGRKRLKRNPYNCVSKAVTSTSRRKNQPYASTTVRPPPCRSGAWCPCGSRGIKQAFDICKVKSLPPKKQSTHRCKHIGNSHKPMHKPKIAKELSPDQLKREFQNILPSASKKNIKLPT
jgi:hypothetical protein